MTDLRQKQPESRHLGLCDQTSGNATFEAMIETWPYSGIKSEDVYPRRLYLTFHAADFRAASKLVQAFATIIRLGHDVWECNVRYVCQRGHYPAPKIIIEGAVTDA
jgi:hypothetical protein